MKKIRTINDFAVYEFAREQRKVYGFCYALVKGRKSPCAVFSPATDAVFLTNSLVLAENYAWEV